MRHFATVSSGFWTSPSIARLSPNGKLVALYLATCKHGNAAGAFHLPIAYMVADLGLTREQAVEALSDTTRMGYASHCDDTGFVVIHKALKHIGKINAKYATHILGAFEALPDEATILGAAADALSEWGKDLPAERRDALIARFTSRRTVEKPAPSAPHSDGVRIPSDTQVQVQVQVKPPSGAAASRPSPGREGSKRKAPPGPEAVDKPPITVETWERYRQAYRKRYGADPVRNATVNAQITQLVKRLGAAAPDVAVHYVGSEERFYVQKGHTLGPLLADCEKVHTEWQTGRGPPVVDAGGPPWWRTPEGAAKRAKELGLSARIGESQEQFVERIKTAEGR